MSNLRVFYGWAKQNKIRKKEAISIIFENGRQDEDRTQRFIKRMQNTIHVRYQTDDETSEAEHINRMYTEYSDFLDSKHFNGSLEAVLTNNFNADSNHVSENERADIKEKLRNEYLRTHRGYKEPKNTQLQINFNE